jgi:hypothetical protein
MESSRLSETLRVDYKKDCECVDGGKGFRDDDEYA